MAVDGAVILFFEDRDGRHSSDCTQGVTNPRCLQIINQAPSNHGIWSLENLKRPLLQLLCFDLSDEIASSHFQAVCCDRVI